MGFLTFVCLNVGHGLKANNHDWIFKEKVKDTGRDDRESYREVNVWKPEMFIFLSCVANEYVYIYTKELEVAVMECLEDWQILKI